MPSTHSLAPRCIFRYPDGGVCDAGDYYAKGFCKKHYTQKYRGRLGKTQEIAAPGDGDQVTFACNKQLKAQAEARAKKLKLNLSQYLRHLIETDTKA